MCYKNESIIDNVPCRPITDTLISVNCSHYQETCNVTQLDNGCVVFNSDGSLQQKGDGGSTHIVVSMPENATDWLLIFVTNSYEPNKRINEVEQYMQKPGTYTIHLEKEVFERLPHPYPSNCSIDGAGSDNLLNMRYSRRNCYESCGVSSMVNKCGAVVDAFQDYFGNGTLMTPGNASANFTRQCLFESLLDVIYLPQIGCRCPYPCSDTSYKHTLQKMFMHETKKWHFFLKYKQRRVTYITEKALISIAQALAYLGGIKSLLVGTSVLSIVEVIIFIGMVISSFIAQTKQLL